MRASQPANSSDVDERSREEHDVDERSREEHDVDERSREEHDVDVDAAGASGRLPRSRSAMIHSGPISTVRGWRPQLAITRSFLFGVFLVYAQICGSCSITGVKPPCTR